MTASRNLLTQSRDLSEAGRRYCHGGLHLVWPACGRTDVEVEDRGGDVDGGARVGDIDYTRQPSLDRSRAQDHVCLYVAVPELGEVIDGVQAGPLIGQVRVQVVLLSGECDRCAGEGQPLAVLGIGDAGNEDGGLRYAVGGPAGLDQAA